MPERRRSLKLSVQIRAEYSSDALSQLVVIENLSRNGVYLRSDEQHKQGQQVCLTMALFDEPISLPGEVVLVDKCSDHLGIAIRFVGLAQEARLELANYMIERNYSAHTQLDPAQRADMMPV